MNWILIIILSLISLVLVGGAVYYYFYIYKKNGVEYKKLTNTWLQANDGDLKKLNLKDGDLSPCKLECTQDDKCDSFTVNHENTVCYLRSNLAGNSTKDNDWDTYMKQTGN